MKDKLKLLKDKVVKNKARAIGLIIVIVVIIAGIAGYFYHKRLWNPKILLKLNKLRKIKDLA